MLSSICGTVLQQNGCELGDTSGSDIDDGDDDDDGWDLLYTQCLCRRCRCLTTSPTLNLHLICCLPYLYHVCYLYMLHVGDYVPNACVTDNITHNKICLCVGEVLAVRGPSHLQPSTTIYYSIVPPSYTC